MTFDVDGEDRTSKSWSLDDDSFVDDDRPDTGLVRLAGEVTLDESFPHEESEVLRNSQDTGPILDTTPSFGCLRGSMRLRSNRPVYLSTAAWGNVTSVDSEDSTAFLGHIRPKDLPKGCVGIWQWLHWLRDNRYLVLYDIVHRTLVLSHTLEQVARRYQVVPSTITRWRNRAKTVYEQRIPAPEGGKATAGVLRRPVKRWRVRVRRHAPVVVRGTAPEHPAERAALAYARPRVIDLLKRGWSINLAAHVVGIDVDRLIAYLMEDVGTLLAEVGKGTAFRQSAQRAGHRPRATTRVDKNEQTRYAIVTAVEAYWRDHGKAPSVRALREAIGSKSTSGLLNHVDTLIGEGRLERDAQGGLCLRDQQP